jgi:hypothetical protein
MPRETNGSRVEKDSRSGPERKLALSTKPQSRVDEDEDA